jgi:hypothetical protein
MDNNSALAKQFFSFLADRMYNENRLSDITWSMCQVLDDFKLSFVKFFFEDIKKEDCREIEIEREKQQDDGRPDFYFEFANKVFLIENKINDKNHHFHQYLQTCKEPSNLGYITNYAIKGEDDIYENGDVNKWKDLYNEGFRVHTWEEFYDYMKTCINNNSKTLHEEERNLWEGYLEYVKKACSIVKINKIMKLDGLYSLYSLIRILEKLCREGKGNNYSLSYPKEGQVDKEKCECGNSGVIFRLIYNSKPDEIIWGWIGVYYNLENVKPGIWIGFSKKDNWGKKYIDKLGHNRLLEGQAFELPYFENNALWFKLNKKQMIVFEKATKVEEQEKILKDFMEEVINYPEFLNKKV